MVLLGAPSLTLSHCLNFIHFKWHILLAWTSTLEALKPQVHKRKYDLGNSGVYYDRSNLPIAGEMYVLFSPIFSFCWLLHSSLFLTRVSNCQNPLFLRTLDFFHLITVLSVHCLPLCISQWLTYYLLPSLDDREGSMFQWPPNIVGLCLASMSWFFWGTFRLDWNQAYG